MLKPKVPVRRMVFHEITKDAITRALEDTRDIDDRLVDAQETRRILDRLYGYEVSPVLWKKVTRGLSAGRVQSVATRLVVQRERERMAFRSAEYWDLLATFEPGPFDARLVAVDGARVAQGKDFVPTTGELRESDVVRLDEQGARSLAARLEGAAFAVRSVDERPYRRKPAAPFRTATLQQEASRKLRFSAQTTMRVAQRLYENGHITYMRTDSTTLSESALEAARAQVRQLFGDDYVPEKPRQYGRAVANAQEAHEAIRPAGDEFRTPKELTSELNRDELALYDLVWKRTLASQMEDARGQTVSLRIGAHELRRRGRGVRRLGHGHHVPRLPRRLRARKGRTFGRRRGARAPAPVGRPGGIPCEPRAGRPRDGSACQVHGADARPRARGARHRPPLDLRRDPLHDRRPRLRVQEGDGARSRRSSRSRSSTCSSATSSSSSTTTSPRGWRTTSTASPQVRRARVEWLGRFYFGDGTDPGLHHLVTDRLDEIDARAVNSIEIPGSPVVVRVGRYGPYLENGDQRASLPADIAPDELTPEKIDELLSQPDNKPLGVDPETHNEIVVRSGRYGPYVTEVLTDGAEEKPRTASLFSSMSPETVTLEEALRLLSLPRVVGELDGEPVSAQNGRYGPYIKRGSESRSLESEEQLFTVTLEQAQALLAEPPRRRGRASARGPLKELGADPASGRPIVLRDGRFGPYVTDGETNASLRRGDTPDALTHERAVELLAERRAKSE